MIIRTIMKSSGANIMISDWAHLVKSLRTFIKLLEEYVTFITEMVFFLKLCDQNQQNS